MDVTIDTPRHHVNKFLQINPQIPASHFRINSTAHVINTPYQHSVQHPAFPANLHPGHGRRLGGGGRADQSMPDEPTNHLDLHHQRALHAPPLKLLILSQIFQQLSNLNRRSCPSKPLLQTSHR